jgi:hypothetical protein
MKSRTNRRPAALSCRGLKNLRKKNKPKVEESTGDALTWAVNPIRDIDLLYDNQVDVLLNDDGNPRSRYISLTGSTTYF